MNDKIEEKWEEFTTKLNENRLDPNRYRNVALEDVEVILEDFRLEVKSLWKTRDEVATTKLFKLLDNAQKQWLRMYP